MKHHDPAKLFLLYGWMKAGRLATHSREVSAVRRAIKVQRRRRIPTICQPRMAGY